MTLECLKSFSADDFDAAELMNRTMKTSDLASYLSDLAFDLDNLQKQLEPEV